MFLFSVFDNVSSANTPSLGPKSIGELEVRRTFDVSIFIDKGLREGVLGDIKLIKYDINLVSPFFSMKYFEQL